jgi:hypothetical protein
MPLARRALAVDVVAALVALGLGLGLPRSAHADPLFAYGLGATWLAKAPAIDAGAVAADSRTVAPRLVANRGGVVLVGGYGDFGVTVADRWVVPLFGAGLHLPAGSYDEIVTSDDGSVTTLRPWSVWTLEALLPGFGLRTKHRRWMVGATLRTGFGVLGEAGSVIGGASSKPFEGFRATFLLLGQVEGCRRLDPMQRLCLEIAPRVYEFGWLAGATVGLRFEGGR